MIHLSRAQVREIDRRASEVYGIPGIVLMENAARAVVDAAHDMLDGNTTGEILVLAGGGNNGGDALAAARHLHNRGADITVALSVDPARYGGDALVNWQIARAMKLDVIEANPDAIARLRPVLVLDGLFGTGLTDPPREPFAALVEAIGALYAPILAIDLPSGLDCDSGLPLGNACITASQTVTFVAPKKGFANPQSTRYTGFITVGDIGCPHELIEQVARGE